MMDEKKERIVIDGNAFYEIDLECMRRKEKENEEEEKRRKKKRQRN